MPFPREGKKNNRKKSTRKNRLRYLQGILTKDSNHTEKEGPKTSINPQVCLWQKEPEKETRNSVKTKKKL